MQYYRQNYVKNFENICFTKRTSNRVLKYLVGNKQTDYILMIDIHITTFITNTDYFLFKKKTGKSIVYSC